MPVVNHLNFFVTSETDCILTIELQDSIQAMVRLDWTVDAFFADGGTTTFVNRVASVLGIHTSRIKVVGVSEGSIVINYVIEPDAQTVSASSGPVTSTTTTTTNDIAVVSANLNNMLYSGSVNLGAPILDYTVVVVSSDGTVQSVRTVEEQKLHPAITAMIVVACVVFAISLVVWIIYKRWAAEHKVEQTAMHHELPSPGKDFHKESLHSEVALGSSVFDDGNKTNFHGTSSLDEQLKPIQVEELKD